MTKLGDCISGFLDRFAELLDEEKPDLLHLHARSSAWGHSAIEIARARGIPAVLTYHIAGTSCMRGDLMRHGAAICSGELRTTACSACIATTLGAPLLLAKGLAMVPQWVGRAASAIPKCKMRTALQLSHTIVMELAAIDRYLKSCARIVVLADWTRELLLRNGVAAERIVLSRVGTHHLQPAPTTGPSMPGVLRGIYVGRLDPTKGIALVADALTRCHDIPLHLDVYGPAAEGNAPLNDTKQLRYQGVLADADVVCTMSGYDFVVVPSQVPETGPFTVIEALQAGVPVIGSDLPAINELITHESNGLLVATGSVDAWEAAFRRLCADSTLLAKLTRAASYSRTMQDVADEMHELYLAVLREKASA